MDYTSNNNTVLFAFPFAGGNSYSYNFLKSRLPRHIVLETFEYPGRGRMSGAAHEKEMPALIDAIARQYDSRLKALQPSSIAVYGHSVGAVVALEFLHFLRNTGRPMPEIAFFSGHGNPVTTPKKILSPLTDSQLIAYFESIGSMQRAITADKELMDYILPILRNDLALYEGHTPLYNRKLDLPFTIINGKDDNISQEDINSWARETGESTEFYTLEGHHFFISQNPAAFSGIIIRQIHEVVTGVYS